MLLWTASDAEGLGGAAAHKRHDLNVIAVVEADRGVLAPGHHPPVVLDRHPLGGYVQPL